LGARRGGRAGKAGQPLTEHGVQAHEAADEAVEVDVHVLVGIAHGDDIVELVVQPEPCRGPETGQSWAAPGGSAGAGQASRSGVAAGAPWPSRGSGWRVLLQPLNTTK